MEVKTRTRILSLIRNSLSSPSLLSSWALSPEILVCSLELFPKRLQSDYWNCKGGLYTATARRSSTPSWLSPCRPPKSATDPGHSARSNCGSGNCVACFLEPGQARLTYRADGGGAQGSWPISSVTLTPKKPQKQLAEGGSHELKARSYSRLPGPHCGSNRVWSWINWMYSPSIGA